MVYEWLSGTRPFQGNALALMYQHLNTPPSSLQGQFPAIFPFVEEVVLKALAKDPKQRFACVRDFAVALEQAYQEAKRFDFDSPVQQTPSAVQVGEGSAAPLERVDISTASLHEEEPRLTNPLVNTDQRLLMNMAIPPQINHDGEIQQSVSCADNTSIPSICRPSIPGTTTKCKHSSSLRIAYLYFQSYSPTYLLCTSLPTRSTLANN